MFIKSEGKIEKTIHPIYFKYFDAIEVSRLVLYREDFRELPISLKNGKHFKTGLFVVEISRTKHKLYIAALKIPKDQNYTYRMSQKNINSLALSP